MVNVKISSPVDMKNIFYAGVVIVCSNQELPINNMYEISLEQSSEDPC